MTNSLKLLYIYIYIYIWEDFVALMLIDNIRVEKSSFDVKGRKMSTLRGSPPSAWSKQACLLLSVKIDLEQVRRFADQSAGKLLVDRGPTNRKCRAFALESAHKTVENYRVYVLPNRRLSCGRTHPPSLKDILNRGILDHFLRSLSKRDRSWEIIEEMCSNISETSRVEL